MTAISDLTEKEAMALVRDLRYQGFICYATYEIHDEARYEWSVTVTKRRTDG